MRGRGYLSVERVNVSDSLSDFELLGDLSQSRTVSATELSGDSDFLCSLTHCILSIRFIKLKNFHKRRNLN